MKKKEGMRQKTVMSELLKERLSEGKRMTAGFIFKAVRVRIGQTILEIQKEKAQQKQQDDMKKGSEAFAKYLKRMEKAKAIINKKNGCAYLE